MVFKNCGGVDYCFHNMPRYVAGAETMAAAATQVLLLESDSPSVPSPNALGTGDPWAYFDT